MVNRVDIVNFATDGKSGLPDTKGTLVAGDLIQGSNPARFTRIKAYTFLTELAIPFESFGNTVVFVVNVSENGPRDGLPPDQLSVDLLDEKGRHLRRLRTGDPRPDFAVVINGERGGKLEVARAAKARPGRPGSPAGEESGVSSVQPEAQIKAADAVWMQVVPAWTADDPAAEVNAKVFEGPLLEFCNRRCDGLLICTGGAFGITLEDDKFYTFDDLGNLKTQVELVNAGKNPLTEGPAGRARVLGTINGSVLTVRKVELL